MLRGPSKASELLRLEREKVGRRGKVKTEFGGVHLEFQHTGG